MAVTIGSNISALRTIRQLDGTTRNLAATSERLASGQRINRASDDAAGLAIASSLDATSRVFSKALANVNDGISLLSITDGAMKELSTVLTRVKELAVQSANGSYSAVQRSALNEEAQKLRDEYNRILATTAFNGVKVLNGSQTTIAIQAGTDGTAAAALQLSAPILGQDSSVGSNYSVSFDGNNDYIGLGDQLDTVTTGANAQFTISTFWKFTSTGGQQSLIGKYGYSGENNREYVFRVLDNDKLEFLWFGDLTGGSYRGTLGSSTLTSGNWYHAAVVYDGTKAVDSRVSLFLNGVAESTSIDFTSGSPSAIQDGTAHIGIGTILNSSGAEQVGSADKLNGSLDELRIYSRALGSAEVATLAGGGELSSAGLALRYDFEEGSGIGVADRSGNGNSGTLTNGAIWSSDVPSVLSSIIPTLESFSLLSVAGARSAMDTVESAFSRLSSEVGKLGSQMSRLQTVIQTISSTRENYQAAAGRIKDADVAQESATLIRNQILQQTASGIIAQANQQPTIALQLLGGL